MVLSKKMTFLVSALIVVIINILMSIIPQLKKIELKTFLDSVMLVIPIMGMFSQSKKQRRQKKARLPSTPIYQLTTSFEGGLYGGAVGGILSGAVIAILVYFQYDGPPLTVCLKVFSLCASIGCLFGVLIYLGRTLFMKFNIMNYYWSNFFGCLSGCLLAGTFSGMLGMLLFGNEHAPFIGYSKIVVASVIGTLGLVFGSLSYEYEGKIKYIIFSLMVALIFSAFIPIIGFLFINDETIELYQRNMSAVYTSTYEYLIKTGAIIGLINGFVFGLVIGFTVVVYKYWHFAEKQRAAHSV